MKRNFLLLALCGLWLAACQKNSLKTVEEPGINEASWVALQTTLNLPATTADYNRRLPKWMDEMGLAPTSADNRKATIGRVLFYDKKLSSNGLVSCASCHQQANGFADSKAKSEGVGGQTLRNSPALANSPSVSASHAPWKGESLGFFWDGRATSVAEQSRQTLHNPIEMGISAETAAAAVRNNAYYEIIWRDAYGSFEPTGDQVLECLSEFVGAIGAANSRFDRGMSEKTSALGAATSETVTVTFDTILVPAYYGTTIDTVRTTTTTTIFSNVFPLMTSEESYGKDIFIKNCSKCHSPVRQFQEVLAACNGLSTNYEDQGIGALTGNPKDNGVFVSPSLRNIARTAPYMHDGRFKTLEQVIGFYSEGIQPHPNLHPLLRDANGQPKNLHLTGQERERLLKFLLTLTDGETATDEKFSNPFKI